jgi:hypothetical protein
MYNFVDRKRKVGRKQIKQERVWNRQQFGEMTASDVLYLVQEEDTVLSITIMS